MNEALMDNNQPNLIQYDISQDPISHNDHQLRQQSDLQDQQIVTLREDNQQFSMEQRQANNSTMMKRTFTEEEAREARLFSIDKENKGAGSMAIPQINMSSERNKEDTIIHLQS